MSDRDDRIRRRAHEIWEREGRPHGKDTDHWERAAREIDAESAAATPPGDAARSKAPARGRSSRLQPGGTIPESGAGAGADAGSRSGKPAGGPKRPVR